MREQKESEGDLMSKVQNAISDAVNAVNSVAFDE